MTPNVPKHTLLPSAQSDVGHKGIKNNRKSPQGNTGHQLCNIKEVQELY